MVFGPIIIGVVLLILSLKMKGHFFQKAWKYALGTFTFYGLLFLAYGEISLMALNIRHYETTNSTTIGLSIGAFFIVVYISYIAAMNKESASFGSFKGKFFRF